MKQNNAEIFKANKVDVDLKEMLSMARENVQREEFEVSKSEEEARNLEIELLQAQAANERKEEAEKKGKETSEKIQEITG